MGYTTETLSGDNGVYQVINIMGCHLNQNQINSIVVGGASTLRTILLNEIGLNVQGFDVVNMSGTENVQTIVLGSDMRSDEDAEKVRFIFNQNWFGGTAKFIGGQFMYGAIDDLEDFGALRVGTAF